MFSEKQIPLNDFFDLRELEHLVNVKLEDNKEYYNKRVGNHHVGEVLYATSPFDPVKSTTVKWQDPSIEARRDVVYELLVKKDYEKDVSGEYLVMRRDEDGTWYKGNSYKDVEKLCDELSTKDPKYVLGENFFIVNELDYEQKYIKNSYIALFINDKRL